MVYTIFGDNLTKEKKYLVFILLFYALNIINTYFVTTAVLNRYVTSFFRTIGLEITATIGNFGFLTIILFLGFLFIKSYKKRSVYMIIVTFLLNFALYALGIFSKYYQTIFSLHELTLMKNPATALGLSILFESLKELLTYYRIVVFIPTVIMIIYHQYFKYSKDKLYESIEKPIFSCFPLNNILVMTGLVLSLFSLGIFTTSMNSNWRIFAERPLYGVQTAGLYNYYFGQIMGFKYDETHTSVNLKDFDEYNKNKTSYTNLWHETYSNILAIDQAPTVILDPSIQTNELNGIFKDKHLVLIHLESFNHFLLDEKGILDETYYPFLKSLLKESYVLDNFYTNVGLGNSSDAEFSVLTGLYATGDTTLYWNYENHNYTFDALPKLFKDRTSYSLHGDVLEFYNRGPVHEEMFGFKDYYYYNPKETNKPDTNNGYYLFEDQRITTPDSPWLSDKALLSWTKELYDRELSLNPDKNLFLYPINIQPHVPYLYDEFIEEPRFTKSDINVDTVTLRYLNYEKSVESYFKEFVEMTKSLKDTVYLFYSDHGSGITLSDYATIFDLDETKLLDVEYNKEMLKTLAFIYAPDDNDTSEIPKGLLKGVQPKVRSQVDVYRTIIELFGLEVDNYYYGVNLLSDETTFSIDTRTFSIITDDYYIIAKRFKNAEVSKDSFIAFNDNPRLAPKDVFEYVYLYKQRMDKALKNNVFYLLRNN